MRIAFFCDSYKPYLSGVTNSVELLATELRNLGNRVYIFAPRYPKHVDTDPDIIRFPSLPTGYPGFRLALPYVNRVPEVDMIHSHSPFQAGLLARYLANKRRLPFIYTFHTLFTRYIHYARFFPEPLSKLSLIGYAQRFCRRCDLIIAPSEMSRRVLRAWKIQAPTEVVPTGVDLARINEIPKDARERIRKKLNIPGDAFVLLYVGRLAKEKNISFLIKAFRALKEKKAYLVLVGSGPLESELKRALPDNVILAGEAGYPEVLSYYLIGDLFVFASLTETQGLVLAEAKAAGLPTVAVFAGGLVDTVRSGIDGYITPRNILDFNSHIRRLMADDALRGKMKKAAKDDARARFSSTAIALAMEGLYRRMFGRVH